MDVILSLAVDFILGIVAAMAIFMWQRSIKDNQKLRRERQEKERQRESAIENGLVCILRKHLMDEHELWIEKRYITSKALESNLSMYKAYKTLGGNGMIDHMEEEIQELPIRD